MKLAVTVCGPIASGKSTAISSLSSEFDLKVVSFGGYVRSIAKQTGGLDTRKALQDLGEMLLKTIGAPCFLESAIRYADVKKGDSVIFDGVRHPEILAEIRRSCERSIAFYLYASQDERHRRYNARQLVGSSYDEFSDIESHPVESRVSELKGVCEMVIDGSQSLGEIQNLMRNEIHGLLSA